MSICFFFFNDTATTEIYTLSLHDALPIWPVEAGDVVVMLTAVPYRGPDGMQVRAWPEVALGQAKLAVTPEEEDRKSTRLNSSHANISYAVFCLKKNI